MHKQLSGTSYLVVATVILMGSLSVAAWAKGDAALNRKLTRTIADVRTDKRGTGETFSVNLFSGLVRHIESAAKGWLAHIREAGNRSIPNPQFRFLIF